MAKRVTFEVELSINASQAVIVGRSTDGRSALYIVSPDGAWEMDETETDGDDWPSPPRGLIREAQALAAGSVADD